MSSRRSGRASGATVLRDPPSSPDDDTHLSVTVKVPSNKLRQATRGGSRYSESFEGGEIVHGKRNRGAKKSYVVDSSPDEDDEEEEEEEEEEDTRIDDDDEMEEGDEDAEGEDEMEVDAEGEDVDAEGEDAEGDIDMAPRATTKDSRSAKSKPTVRAVASKPNRYDDVEDDDDDDDDDELSDPADSDLGDETMGYGDETMADEDAEGEEIEVAGDEEVDDDEEEEEEDTTTVGRRAAVVDSDLDSDEEGGSRGDTPDLAKMTKRQRARFEDVPQEYMKLSDEIQVKKVFTAEELSMRRQEMARRRRNLSEKRNEEVKMETINKLLKKQAPKINRKAAGAGEMSDGDRYKPNPVFIRWVSNKNGSQVAVPGEILEGPIGKVFSGKPSLPSGKMAEEVA